jgi:hypothetical protein
MALPKLAHTHVSITRLDGSEGGMTLHVIDGTPDETNAHLLGSIDALFDVHADE